MTDEQIGCNLRRCIRRLLVAYFMMYILLYIFIIIRRPPPRTTLFPYTTLFRSQKSEKCALNDGAKQEISSCRHCSPPHTSGLFLMDLRGKSARAARLVFLLTQDATYYWLTPGFGYKHGFAAQNPSSQRQFRPACFASSLGE